MKNYVLAHNMPGYDRWLTTPPEDYGYSSIAYVDEVAELIEKAGFKWYDWMETIAEDQYSEGKQPSAAKKKIIDSICDECNGAGIKDRNDVEIVCCFCEGEGHV